MRQIAQQLLVTLGLILLGGCASMDQYIAATEYYRTSERFDRIEIDVRASEGFAKGPESYRDLHSRVEADLKYYLDHLGINSSTPDSLSENSGQVRLEVTINVRNAFNYFEAIARLVGKNGMVLRERTLGFRRGAGLPPAISQQVAESIADYMLLMWHPSMAVMGDKLQSGPAYFSLLPFAIEVDASKHQSRFTWESFPSERIMQGADFTVNDISDVSYEIRLRPYPFNDFVRNTKPVYRVSGLTTPEHTLPFSLPTCERARWSVRAHFKLYGNPRVTQWSDTLSGTLSGGLTASGYFHQAGNRYAGVQTYDDVSGQFKCNLSDKEPKDVLPHLELDELQTGQSIAAVALISDFCDEDGCEARMTTQEASENMAGCLADEFRNRGMNTKVHDMAKLLGELPAPPALGVEPKDSEDMFSHFRRPENRNYLDSQGIRYVVMARLSMKTTGSEKNVNTGEAIGLVVASTETHYSSSMDSRVFDIKKGKVVATLNNWAEGETGVAVPMHLFIPLAVIPHGSKSRIENRACDAMARQLVFALKGGVAGWPVEFFKYAINPQWEYEEQM